MVQRGITIVALARLTGISYSALARIVGGYGRPSAETSRAVAKALGMNSEELWGKD